MTATVEQYLAIVAKAYAGSIKLPAFQRKWRWKPNQVTLLFDSLRQGFPIGSFLFIKNTTGIDLGPREFQGASDFSEAAKSEYLVLDGQQRITAGLELFHRSSSVQYFIDLERVHRLTVEQQVDFNDTSKIREFLASLEAEDRYCIARKAVPDPEVLLTKRHLLWTQTLVDEIELERALKKYVRQYPDRDDFISYVIGKNFRPRSSSNIPITVIDDDVSVEAISRIFSTLNSTGKMLTPFELVVSILYPHQVSLAEDVEAAREKFPYYRRIDATGDILLQTIALFDGLETRKAALPKTITPDRYRFHFDDTVLYLNEAGKILTEKIGLGLDQSSELLVYPVIFSPMAYVLRMLNGKGLSAAERAAAEHKLAQWFIGAVLARRYQQSTHDKQARDKVDILSWINAGDEAKPLWLREVQIPNLKTSDPDGAIGKLLRALLNSRGLHDPLTNKAVGIGSGKRTSAKHHIFPSRFVGNLTGWRSEDNANRALNIMYCEETTNSSWLNMDPALQIKSAINSNHSELRVREVYLAHGIDNVAFDMIQKTVKSRDDYYQFLAEREKYFVGILEKWGFSQQMGMPEEAQDLLEE